MHRILITGAAGRLGTILRNGLRGRFPALRLLDIAPLGTAQPGEELLSADIRDLATVIEATADVDRVVHLAGIPDEDSFQRILDVNMVGTYNVFEAARRQHDQRAVLASSAHVTGFYLTSQRIGPDVPPRPDTFYGRSANPRGWWDTSQAERLGYHPLDNAEHWAAQLDPTTAGADDPDDGLQGGAYTRRQSPDQAG